MVHEDWDTSGSGVEEWEHHSYGVHRESCAIMRRNRIHKVRFLLGCRACPWLALPERIKEGGVREVSRSMDKILESREMDLFERRKKNRK